MIKKKFRLNKGKLIKTILFPGRKMNFWNLSVKMINSSSFRCGVTFNKRTSKALGAVGRSRVKRNIYNGISPKLNLIRQKKLWVVFHVKGLNIGTEDVFFIINEIADEKNI